MRIYYKIDNTEMKYLNHEKEICMIDLITASIQSYTKTMKKLLVRIEVEMIFAA